MKICRENPNFLKIRREYRAFYQQLQDSLIAAATLKSHKVALFN
jgi:hypothetical protein